MRWRSAVLGVVLLGLFLACKKKVKTDDHLPDQEIDAVQDSTGNPPRVSPTVTDPVLLSLLASENAQMGNEFRRDWPFVAWTHARAYTYNFSSKKSGIPRYVWSESGWAEGIQDTIDLSAEQAMVALELTHRTGGALVTTKCPIVPRHSVVFFNDQDQPVASMNICFSCQDTTIWPKYYKGDEEARSRFEVQGKSEDTGYAMPVIIGVQEEVIQKWQLLFDHVDAPRWEKYSGGE